MTMDWKHKDRSVSLSMPRVVPSLIKQFAHLHDGKLALSPAVYVPPTYGETIQFVRDDTSPRLSDALIKDVQSIVGITLHYARTIDTTILPQVNFIASEQSHPTEQLLAAVVRLLQYLAAYPCNVLVLRACDMVYYIQSDASYQSRRSSRSVAGGVHYLGNHNQPFHINAPFLAMSSLVSVVCASAAEAEYAALFMNARLGEVHRTILAAFGYPQDPTPIYCDNSTAIGLANKTVKPKQAKAMDMRFHWIQDRVQQGHFVVIWRNGPNNLADFFTKILPVHVHQEIMHLLVYAPRYRGTKKRILPKNQIMTSKQVKGMLEYKSPP